MRAATELRIGTHRCAGAHLARAMFRRDDDAGSAPAARLPRDRGRLVPYPTRATRPDGTPSRRVHARPPSPRRRRHRPRPAHSGGAHDHRRPGRGRRRAVGAIGPPRRRRPAAWRPGSQRRAAAAVRTGRQYSLCGDPADRTGWRIGRASRTGRPRWLARTAHPRRAGRDVRRPRPAQPLSSRRRRVLPVPRRWHRRHPDPGDGARRRDDRPAVLRRVRRPHARIHGFVDDLSAAAGTR